MYHLKCIMDAMRLGKCHPTVRNGMEGKGSDGGDGFCGEGKGK